MAGDRADRFEELAGLVDRHAQDVPHVPAVVGDVEGLAVVSRALADLAGDVDVGQEVHLDLDRPVPPAGLASASLDVEGDRKSVV